MYHIVFFYFGFVLSWQKKYAEIDNGSKYIYIYSFLNEEHSFLNEEHMVHVST